MMTGADYLESLDDGRKTFFHGEQVTPLTANPILGNAAEWVSRTYDTYYDPTPGAISKLLDPPRRSRSCASGCPCCARPTSSPAPRSAR